MTHSANPPFPERGRFRRALGAVLARLQAMESTSFDTMLDRIERLERKVRQPSGERRQGDDATRQNALR